MRASQFWRLVFLLFYLIVLCLASFLLFGVWFPRPDDTSVWFYSGLFALLLGDLLLEPYFTAPRDAISNSIAAITQIGSVLFLVIVSNVQWFWIVALAFPVVALISGIVAILLGQSRWLITQRIAATATQIGSIIGKSKFLFTAIFVLAVFSFHTTITETFWLLTLWIIIFAARPIERAYDFVKKFIENWKPQLGASEVGVLIGHRQPGVYTIEITNTENADNCDLLCVLSDNASCALAVVTDRYALAGSSWLRALRFASGISKDKIKGVWGSGGTVLACPGENVPDEFLSNPVYKKRNDLIGIVVEDSSTNTILIELLRDNTPIVEGRMLTAEINGQSTLYQVIEATTQSEHLKEQNRHGFLRIKARKLGNWNSDEGVFEQVEWIPKIYTPVFLVPQSETQFCEDCVGYIPGTDYGIEMTCSDLVTHNTAVLGVLGTGKSFLAFELVDRIARDSIKCFVIDITNEYQPQLERWVDVGAQEASNTRIAQAIEASRERVDLNQSTGGNHPAFSQVIAAEIATFMGAQNWQVRIFNPLQFYVTWQTRGAYNNQAAFAEMTPSQITSLVAEALLAYAQAEMSAQARLCLVLEEAHSLVPEWNSITVEGERAAVMTTARSILQGRKYGLGCLIITQRTANVTKSILNQCNTVFALQTFDATGMEFLANYIGADYTGILSTLKPRTCVAYGRGLNSQTPVIIGLNDREVFLNGFTFPETEPEEDPTAF